LTVFRFDVYKFDQDERTVELPTIECRVGEQEDVKMTVNPVDIGFDANSEIDSFVIPVHSFREWLEELRIVFVSATLDKM